ncbi:MAG TPA: helix-turn-helix domain-containing protein [Acidimicrobiales bacterium]|nr:helix-turn-helix domain-containing protein [Acidimicrobiales bacterium]
MTGSRATQAHQDDQLCSIAASLQLIGDRWSLLILRDAFRGVRRFDELAADLGIARNLLADRLQKLVDHGILVKQPYQQRPVRYEYRLSAKGIDLSPALVALMHWGDKHVLGESPPVVLVHARCGTPLEQTLTCPQCAEAVTPRSIKSRPGPGAVRPTKTTRRSA